MREKADGYFANTKGWHSEAADCQHSPKDRSIANEKAIAYNIAVRSDTQIKISGVDNFVWDRKMV